MKCVAGESRHNNSRGGRSKNGGSGDGGVRMRQLGEGQGGRFSVY